MSTTAPGPAHRLRELVLDLDRTDRCLLLLHYADQLTPPEIAQILGMPVPKVTSRLDALVGVLRRRLRLGDGDAVVVPVMAG